MTIVTNAHGEAMADAVSAEAAGGDLLARVPDAPAVDAPATATQLVGHQW
ncbi:hypothetical protein [Micromonospora sp. NBC_00421]